MDSGKIKTSVLTTPAAPAPVDPALHDGKPPTTRLASLDVFRGIVILAMLIVNNIGDSSTVGYFWQHADWQSRPLLAGFHAWMQQSRQTGWSSLGDFPLFRNCTLADFVMPMFMLIIGVAIPFSAASARRRGNTGAKYWLGVIRRGLTLYALGWCIDLSLQFIAWRNSTNPHDKLILVLGMNVLQLLGISFIFARLVYSLPLKPRLILAALLFVAHWSLLRFVPQGPLPAGTFTESHNVPGYIYDTWAIFRPMSLLSWLQFNIVGMLSVPPAVAMITLGTWIGDVLRDARTDSWAKIRRLIIGAGLMLLVGIAWSCDLPMNKPRWTPCYLVYCAGVGSLCIAFLYWLIDVRAFARLAWVFAVFGTNAIGIYFLSIMAKIWFLHLPRVMDASGHSHSLLSSMIVALERDTTPWAGSWLFTILYCATIWCFAAVAYKKRIIWKV
jgi:predicted acyltransferase